MSQKRKYTYNWPRPMVTVDAIVFTLHGPKPKLLLIKRRTEPFKGKWALPGGFVGINEELEDAVARELAEETHLKGITLEQMHTFGKCGRDPRGRQITIAFIGIAPKSNCKIRPGDDAAEAKWFDIDNVPEDMAFDHCEVTEFAIQKIKNKRNINRKLTND